MVQFKRAKKKKARWHLQPNWYSCGSCKMQIIIWPLFIYYTIFPQILVDTTSNINSVWLTSSESASTSWQALNDQTKLNRANLTIKTNTTNLVSSGSGLVVRTSDEARTGNLHAASSSLQPAIASLDGPTTSWPIDKKQGERRADGLSFWDAQVPTLKHSNAQVQFDDQHQTRDATTSVQGHHQASLMNDTQLSIGPHNPLPDTANDFSGSAVVGEAMHKSNKTSDSPELWLTSPDGQRRHRVSPTSMARTNASQSSLSLANYLYYLPDVDRWNWNEISTASQVPESGTALVSDQRRKLSGGPKYQASLEPALSYTSPLDVVSRIHSPAMSSPIQQLNSAQRQHLNYPDKGLQSVAPALAVPLAPTNQYADHQRLDWEPTNGLFPAQQDRKQLLGQATLVDNQHRFPPYIRTSQFSPKAGRPKKSSLLGSVLGGRFNQESDENLTGSNNVSYSRALESAFYGLARRPHQATRFPGTNNYQLDGLNRVARPPAYSLVPPVYYATASSPGISRKPWSPTLKPVITYPNRASPRRPQAGQLASETRIKASQVTRGADRLAQPGSFIPVVAVSVTQTSPPPKPTNEQRATDTEITAELDSTTNELDEYLALKTGYKPARYNQDDFGSLASGSTSSLSGSNEHNRPGGSASSRHRKQEQSQQKQAKDQHTTTVKSAVFGYLPQQANEPILRALQVLNQDAIPTIPLVSDSIEGDTRDGHQRVLRRPSRLVDYYSPAASDLEHSHTGRELPPVPGWPEEPPSLTLQLQANNFLHNDIAHPFGDFHSKQQYPGVSAQSSGLTHLYAAPTATILGAYQSNRYNPNIQFGHSAPTEGAALLAAAASPAHLYASGQADLNPLLGPLVFDTSQSAHYPRVQSSPIQQQSKRVAPSPIKQSSAEDQEDQETDESEPQQLSSKGKKRSSEFFANAGQLLLSALPLLLAPTLGLMFASPSPAARYHGSIDRPAVAVGGSSGALHTSLPSGYINGVVSNASPSPLLFTPTPPGATSSTPATTPAAQDAHTVGNFGRNQSLVAPKSSTFSVTPGPSRMTFLVTTVEPDDSGNRTSIEPNSTSQYSKESHRTTHTNESTILSNQTIVLLTPDIAQASASWLNSVPADQDNATARRNTVNHYETGYEGADFDAQFPTLKRSSSRNSSFPEVNVASSLDKDKLYPVSSRPSSRRKTVSLVTSSGNKTHVDATEKYGPQLNSHPTEQMLKILSSGRQRPSSVMRLIDDFTLRRFKRQLVEELERPKPDERRGAIRVARRVLARKADPSLALTTVSQRGSGNESSMHDDGNLHFSSKDQLAGDSSRSKPAHIITTMITQLDPDTDNDIQDSSDLRDLRGRALRKKLQLERLNGRNNLTANLDEQSYYHAASQQVEDDLVPDAVYSNARGRIKPIRVSPIEVITAKVRVYPNNGTETDSENEPPATLSAAPASKSREMKIRNDNNLTDTRSNLVLTEDTKRALAEFGSLFIKDTLEMPKEQQKDLEQITGHNYSDFHSMSNRPLVRARKKQLQEMNYLVQRVEDSSGSAATERSIAAASFPHSTTRSPHEQGWRLPHQPMNGFAQPPFVGERASLFEPDMPSYGPSDDRASSFAQRDHDYRNGHGYQPVSGSSERFRPVNNGIDMGSLPGMHYHYTAGYSNRTHGLANLGPGNPSGGYAHPGEPRQWSPSRDGWPNYAQPSVTADQYAFPRPMHYYEPQRPSSRHAQGGSNMSALGDYTSSFDPSMPAYHQSKPIGDYSQASIYGRPMPFHQHGNSHINHQHNQYGSDNHLAAPAFPPSGNSGHTTFGRAPGDYSSASAETYHRKQPFQSSGVYSPRPPPASDDIYPPPPLPGLAASLSPPQPMTPSALLDHHYYSGTGRQQAGSLFKEQNSVSASSDRSDSQTVSDYLKRVQFSDSDRDRLMARLVV